MRDDDLSRLHEKVRQALTEVVEQRNIAKQLLQELAEINPPAAAAAPPSKDPEREALTDLNGRLEALLTSCPAQDKGEEASPAGLSAQRTSRREARAEAKRARQAERERQITSEMHELQEKEKELAQLKMAALECSTRAACLPSVPGLPLGQAAHSSGDCDASQEQQEQQLGEEPGSAVASPAPPPAVPKGKACPPGPPPPPGSARSPRGSVPKPPPPSKFGKAKAPGNAPVCKAKAKSKTRASIAIAEADVVEHDEAVDDNENSAQTARLVNLHWRPSQGPAKETDLYVTNDGYLEGLSEMVTRWGNERADRMRQIVLSFEDRVVGLSAAEAKVTAQAVADTWQPEPAAPPGRRRRRHTVFSGTADVRVLELPHHQLAEFFQARSASFDMSSRASCVTTVSTLIGDSTHQRILDLMVRSEAIQRQKETSSRSLAQGVDQAVEDLLAALTRCDYSRISTSALDDMRKVASSHMENGNSIVSYVESRSVEALSGLEHPHLHRLLYGMMRIPAVPLRLECMAFVARWKEDLEHCRQNLQVLRQALLSVSERLGVCRRFWAITLQLGNALNRGSPAPVTERGFRLSSLLKLLDVKSSQRKEMTLFHFALLWMDPLEIQELRSPDFLRALQAAQSKRMQIVCNDLLQQLDGFHRIEQLFKTGKLKGVEIPRNLPEATLADGDACQAEDPFFVCMGNFVKEARAEYAQVWSQGEEVIRAYKDLGLFFDDLPYVYPPPKEDQEGKTDLFDVLCKFVLAVKTSSEEIDSLALANEVESKAELHVPFCGAADRPIPSRPVVLYEPVKDTSCESDEASHPRREPEKAEDLSVGAAEAPLITSVCCDRANDSEKDREQHLEEAAVNKPAIPTPLQLSSMASPQKAGPVVGMAREAMRLQLPKSPMRSPMRRNPGTRRDLEVKFDGEVSSMQKTEEVSENSAPDVTDCTGLAGPNPLSKMLESLAPLSPELSKDSDTASVPSFPVTPTAPPPNRTPSAAAGFSTPSMPPPRTPGTPVTPTVPPPKRGPPQYRLGQWVLGAPPLTLPPAESPCRLPSTPGTSGSQAPDYTRTRKSLTRQADRAVADCLGHSVSRVRGVDSESIDSWHISSSSPSSPPRTLSPSSSGGSVTTPSERAALDGRNHSDLQSQLIDECRRRKSRGTPSMETRTLHTLAVPASRGGFDSPPTPPGGRLYPLTPVQERGETPYRVTRR
eukprot:TRINITY_DN7354_c0_g1_i1.p1 TRINITY_DN7354_c0_g1~~TRINITY_DN7354_c0_g1_i1.p1  ORF type:complete len:1200 (+),score=251.02 TRINITY_DN7354_c0_g1_i1:172-3771(+)